MSEKRKNNLPIRQAGILITGGAGFIGSHLVEALLKRGDFVVCLDNFNDFYNPKQKELNIKPFLQNPNFKLYRADIRDVDGLRETFKENKIQKIVHLAAQAGVRGSQTPAFYREVNIAGTMNLLDMAREFGIKKFVFASSSSVYGKNKKIPFSESDRTDQPISPYAATKKAGELLCHTYHHLYEIAHITCLRFFTVYGPKGRPDMAPYKFVRIIAQEEELPLLGSGLAQRDFTYIDDIVSGVLSAVDKNFGFEIINLGNSQPVNLRYFISVIENLVGKKAKIKKLLPHPCDVPVTFADISKAKKLLGYMPETKIEEGMEKFIKWYQNEEYQENPPKF